VVLHIACVKVIYTSEELTDAIDGLMPTDEKDHLCMLTVRSGCFCCLTNEASYQNSEHDELSLCMLVLGGKQFDDVQLSQLNSPRIDD